METFLDTFSGSVAQLKPKQKGNEMIVLKVLADDPNVSTWDMTESKIYPLWKTLDVLVNLGYIVSVESPYPWHRFEVTELGHKVLEEYKKQSIKS